MKSMISLHNQMHSFQRRYCSYVSYDNLAFTVSSGWITSSAADLKPRLLALSVCGRR